MRAVLREFIETHDVLPPPQLHSEHGAAAVASLVKALIPVARAGPDAPGGLDAAADATLALRLISRGAGAEAEAVLRDDGALLLDVARAAGLSDAGLACGWDPLAAESAALLNNLLVLRGSGPGGAALSALPLRTDLDAEARVAVALTEPGRAHLHQLLLYTSIAFRLSLLPPPAAEVVQEMALADALVALLGWCVEGVGKLAVASTSGPPDDTARAQLLQLSECASRALFNCLRAGATRRLAEGAMASLSSLLAVTPSAIAGASGGARDEALDSAQRTALQLGLAASELTGFGLLVPLWRNVISLLLPLARELEAGLEPGDRRMLVPLLVAQRIAEADREVASQMRAEIFGPGGNREASSEEEEGSAERLFGRDPNALLGGGAPLSAHLLKLMCASDHVLKSVVAQTVLALCGGDVQEFVGLAGVGPTAGLLAEMNLLSH